MDVLKIKAKETICDIERAETKRKNLLRYLRLAKERADLADEERDSLKEKIKNKKEELENLNKETAEKDGDRVAKEEEAEESARMKATPLKDPFLKSLHATVSPFSSPHRWESNTIVSRGST